MCLQNKGKKGYNDAFGMKMACTLEIMTDYKQCDNFVQWCDECKLKSKLDVDIRIEACFEAIEIC